MTRTVCHERRVMSCLGDQCSLSSLSARSPVLWVLLARMVSRDLLDEKVSLVSEVHLVELDLLGNLVNKDFQALRVILDDKDLREPLDSEDPQVQRV